ncbi:MAG: ATP-dependent Clp protease ATP-binding subunit ClpA, partial [Sulfurovum sp.]|nr:ATP-dependent Clp protease ATP-binding subunit ClpA [Sulfurovaceae bacterium]
MISSELTQVFKEAFKYAQLNHHEYLTLEHVFWAIIDSDDGWAILSMLDVNPDELTRDIENHLRDTIVSVQNVKKPIEPIETITLTETVNSMIRHIRSSGRDVAHIGDMLVSIMEQEDTYCKY